MEELLNPVAIVSLGATAVMALIAYILVLLLGRSSSLVDKYVLGWLIWDTMIHFSLEGPFVLFSLTGTVNKATHWLAFPWHEYARADRRWGESDETIVSLEVLTVTLAGPLCMALVYAIVRNKPYRHWLQIVLCVCELYGGWMTFAPEWLTGSPNLVTSNWLYLWVYLVFFNGLWVVVPLALLVQSYQHTCRAFSATAPGGKPQPPRARHDNNDKQRNKYYTRKSKHA